MLLTLGPIIAFITTFMLLRRLRPDQDWRRSLLRAAVIIGLYSVLVLEVLSLFNAIQRLNLVLFWLLPAMILLVWISSSNVDLKGIFRQRLHLPGTWLERLMLFAILAIVAITGVIAWFAPPNTYDSLTYHMPRVAHWAQNSSLKPFATGILRQLYMSPGAEMGILHLYVLTQSDRLANFVQWAAMVLSLIAVSYMASQLGADRRGQIFSALFAATLPMGIAQASSTMTDYVAAMWVILAVIESLALIKEEPRWEPVLYAGAAVGLALLTKPNVMPFLLPFAVWVFVMGLKSASPTKMLAFAGVGLMLILLINAGHFTRNWVVFGDPLGGGSNVARFSNEVFSLPHVASNVLRNLSLHVGTPWGSVNDFLYSTLAKVHWKLGVDLTDPRTSIHPFFRIWPYAAGETRTPNTLHAILLVFATALMPIFRKRFGSKSILYLASISTGFLIFSALFKFTVFGSRYHMTFFLLAAPVVGLVFGRLFNPQLIVGCSILLMMASFASLFNLDVRPLNPGYPGGNVIRRRRIDQYFVSAPQLDEPFYEMTELIESNSCRKVSLILSGDTAEYLLWVFLDTPRSDLTIDWIIARSDTSGNYRIDGFEPCAVVCEQCSDQEAFYNNLPLIYDSYGYRLYLQEIQ